MTFHDPFQGGISILEYIGIPFRCNHCHGYGHLGDQCSLSFHSQEKKTYVWRVKKEVGIDLVKPGDMVFPENPSLPIVSGPSMDLGLNKGIHVLDKIKPLALTNSHTNDYFFGFNVCNPV